MSAVEQTPQAYPKNPEAERAIIGAFCKLGSEEDQAIVDEVLQMLKSSDFSEQKHRLVFQAAKAIREEGQCVDLLMLIAELERMGSLEDVGGEQYLTYCAEITPSAWNARGHASIVQRTSIHRATILAAESIAHRGFNLPSDDSVEKLLEDAQKTILRIESWGAKNISLLKGEDGLAARTLERIERGAKGEAAGGISTGLSGLDYSIGGFREGNLIILGARPAIGKTSLCLNFISHAVLEEAKNVLFISLEMSETEIMMRLLSMDSKINSRRLGSRDMTDGDIDKLFRSYEKWMNAQGDLAVADKGISTIGEIRGTAAQVHSKQPLDMVVIDYLQLIGGDEESREREVANATRQLKLLAKDLGVPVIAASQLSRQAEARPNKRPQLSDLRESGAIEQDADIVMLLHRQESKDDGWDGKVKVIIAKQRNGPTGETDLLFLGPSRGVPSFETPAWD